jgi:hypothetical protein
VTERSNEPGSDPVAEFQRWLMRAGARGLGREVADKVRNTLGNNSKADVWETATGERPGEAPECAWCPICRAARMLRDGGPGLGSHLADVGDTLAGFAQEAVSVFESAIKEQQQAQGNGTQARNSARSDSARSDSARSDSARSDSARSDSARSDSARSDNGPVVGTRIPGRPPVHAEHEHGETADERGDGAEGRDAGHGPADGGGDEQVGGPAE